MKPRVREQDEFMLSRLLDGDLPAEEASMLRDRMQREPELRAACDGLARIDELLGDRRGDQPQIDYGQFHRQVMAQLAAEQANPPIEESDEFALSRLLDGDLPADETEAVRARLGRDAGLRDRLDALARVDALLARHRADQPDIDYDRFRHEVMQRVAEEPARRERTIRFPTWLRIMAPMAVAAAIALVVLLRPQGPVLPDEGAQPGSGSVASDDRPADQQPAIAKVAPPEESRTTVAVADRSTVRGGSTIMVRVNRPGAPARDEQARRRVVYTRSDELARITRRDDEQQRSRPSRTLFFALASQPPAPEPPAQDIGFLDAAPL